ncbi:glycosyltransferase family 2 protein [Streptodolium elevatio]
MSGTGDRRGRRRAREGRVRRANKRERRNRIAHRAYLDCATVAGPLNPAPDGPYTVAFRAVARPWTKFTLHVLVLVNVVAGLAFVGWLLLPEHVPGAGITWVQGWKLTVARIAFCAVIIVELTRLVQTVSVWIFASRAKDPLPVEPESGLRVAVLTTIVPAKEPIEIVERTLVAMKEIEYDGQVDVWILDEGDDPEVKAMAARIGVHHFSRKGRPEYNRLEGEFRAKTKSGNHNSWRAEHEHNYDVVAQMDPDHVPLTCFLERTLGYFRDPDVAFVVAPQVYGNMYDNWVAHGAGVQQFMFSGVVERGGNGLDAPLLIGTNHLYRPTAWRQIGGYQDSIIEDHLTSMRVQGTDNPATGNRWKGVYTPDVLAIGEGPTSWTDYFNQQKRWAYGIWEILLDRKMRSGIRLSLRQRILYGFVQFYYPSVAVTSLLGIVATATYLLCGISAMRVNGGHWLALWAASMGSWFVLWLWLRRFNLAAHERREVGAAGIALTLFAGPVYVSAAIAAILRRPLAYAVTAKGELRSAESLSTFRLHLFWAALAGGLIGASIMLSNDQTVLRVWAGLALFTGLMPPLMSLFTGRRAARDAVKAAASRAEQLQEARGRAAAKQAKQAERAEQAKNAAEAEEAKSPRGAGGQAHVPMPRATDDGTAHPASDPAGEPASGRTRDAAPGQTADEPGDEVSDFDGLYYDETVAGAHGRRAVG